MCTYTPRARSSCGGSSRNSFDKKRAKKQVQFQDESNLEERFEFELVDVGNLEEEKYEEDGDATNSTWMTRADFRAIQYDIRRALQASYDGRRFTSTNDEEENCFRGLEKIVSYERRNEIQAFIQDVLEMQELSSGPNGLHVFSENNSRLARERARKLGDRDASEAQQVYAESLLSEVSFGGGGGCGVDQVMMQQFTGQ